MFESNVQMLFARRSREPSPVGRGGSVYALACIGGRASFESPSLGFCFWRVQRTRKAERASSGRLSGTRGIGARQRLRIAGASGRAGGLLSERNLSRSSCMGPVGMRAVKRHFCMACDTCERACLRWFWGSCSVRAGRLFLGEGPHVQVVLVVCCCSPMLALTGTRGVGQFCSGFAGHRSAPPAVPKRGTFCRTVLSLCCRAL
jgi:hypothetical protein